MIATGNKATDLSKERVVDLYRKMLAARQFDTTGDDLFSRGFVPSSIHTCIGQEAVPVGVCSTLRDDDYVFTSHRGHGWFLAKGAPVDKMMAELLGRRTGLCKGKSGSMHFAWAEKGLLGSQGIVGQSAPIAVGVGMAIKYRKKDQVVVVQLGDGSSSEGAVHEAMNMAGAWKLPVIFALENNQYAVSVPAKSVISVPDLAVRGAGYGMPGEVVDGMDVLAVCEAAQRAVNRARRGEGPSLIEFKTYRFRGHSRGDPKYGPYRTKEEYESWMKRDALQNLATQGGLSADEIADLEREVKAMIADAVEYAKGSPVPAPEEALDDLYA